ncbi:hypothetical protein BKA70DRAFT_1312885 [Coprinopsis sp. MPI-PUGE-AT-0042]|nr:hypothetical protein BKA70DRAFT_1312885 [Coprinopsis sp. MPI-PUGE-AT-0042]
MSSKQDEQQGAPVDYYAVLNVNRGATPTEINERHRSLSLIFHPDKQRNPDAVEVATEEFLKVQKAYQGERGLAVKWPPKLTSKSRDEIRKELNRMRDEGSLDDQKQEPGSPPDSTTMVTLVARDLFRVTHSDEEPIPLSNRLKVMMVNQELSHNVSKRVGPSTTVGLKAQANVQGKFGGIQYVGTVRHQFSPRFTAKTDVIFGRHLFANLTGTYRDDYNTVNATALLAPFGSHAIPSLEVTYGRRLWKLSPQTAEITLNLQQNPSLRINFSSPPSLTQEILDENAHGLPSTTGMKYLVADKSVALVFTSFLPKLLSTRIQAGFELGFNGLGANLGARWSPEDGREVGVVTSMSSAGVFFRVDFTLWKQRVTLPVVFSTEYEPFAALCSLVLPTTAAALGYHFIVRPRRRALRIAQIRAARQALDGLDDSDARRKRGTVAEMLKDPARRAMNSENLKGGLIVESATYGVLDTEDEANELTIDVTVPLQALVRNSQLSIPGNLSKSDLQGFSDPAPFTSKALRVHYSFRGRPHYTEIPDHLPVVLPLSEHALGDC